MSPASFPAKFLVLVIIFHLKSAVYADDAAAVTSPFSCSNCNICQSTCRPPPSYEPQPLPPPPPPPIAEPESLPVPNSPANCPPAVVQCCTFMPPPPPPLPPRNGNNIYTPLYNQSGSSFLKGGLVSVLVSVFWFAAIF